MYGWTISLFSTLVSNMKYLAQKTTANTKITVHFEPGLFIMMIISMLKMLKILKILNSIPKHMVPTDTLFKISHSLSLKCDTGVSIVSTTTYRFSRINRHACTFSYSNKNRIIKKIRSNQASDMTKWPWHC